MSGNFSDGLLWQTCLCVFIIVAKGGYTVTAWSISGFTWIIEIEKSCLHCEVCNFYFSLFLVWIYLSDWSGAPENRPLLIFVYFSYFYICRTLSPTASCIYWYWSCSLCSELPYVIYGGGGPSRYMYCVVCYHHCYHEFISVLFKFLYVFYYITTMYNLCINGSLCYTSSYYNYLSIQP